MWTKEEIGQIIKESRVAASLTQKQVAAAISRPQQTIASWESGKSQPDANTLFELFQVLGRSVDEAFGFTKQPFEVTKYEIEHIKKYRALDWHGKEMIDVVLEKEIERVDKEEEQIRAAAVRAERERTSRESAEEMPTPVPEDGQGELEEFVRKHKANLTEGQRQQVLEMMQAMIVPQKSRLSASAQEKVDGTSPKTEDPGQSQ